MPQEPAVELFAEQLRNLRAAAGNPPLAEIARLASHRLSGRRIAKATIHDQLSGRRKRLPEAPFVAAFYEACLEYALLIGRGSERLGTRDDWLNLLDAAARGDAELVSPVRGAPAAVPAADSGADPAAGTPPPAVPRPPAADGGAGRGWHRDLRQAATVVSVLVTAAVAVAGLLVFWLVERPASPARPSAGRVRPQTPVASPPATAPQPAAASHWIFPTFDSVDGSAVAADGDVYIADDSGYIYALNAISGHQAWKLKESSQIDSTPYVLNGTLYVGDHNGDFYAINTVTRKIRWQRHFVGGIDSSPAVAGGVVYFGDGDNYVHALDIATGATVWTYQANNTVQSSPAVVNGVVYVGSEDGSVYALSAGDGHRIWSFHTNGPVDSSPAVSGGVVYIGSDDQRVYALRASSGAVLWTQPVGGKVTSKPLVAGGMVYVSSGDGRLYQLDARNGTRRWRTELGGPLDSSPASYGGLIYVGSAVSDASGSLCVVSTSGRIVASYQTGAQVQSSPLVAGGWVYVGSDNDEVLAFRLPAT